jgi:hypothetical protein
MQEPWRNQTGIAKFTTIFAVTLVVATGLCGANYFVIQVIPFRPTSSVSNMIGQALVFTAFLESAAMVISLLGLILIGIIAIARAIKNHFTTA